MIKRFNPLFFLFLCWFVFSQNNNKFQNVTVFTTESGSDVNLQKTAGELAFSQMKQPLESQAGFMSTPRLNFKHLWVLVRH